MKSSSGLLAGALLLVAVPAWAQTPTLGELAKKQQEQKKTTPPATRTFTNDDLKKISVPPAPEGDTKPADAKSGDAAKGGDPAKSGDAAKGDAAKSEDAKGGDAAGPKQDEKYWHSRMDAAREDVRRNQAFRDALQSRINGLTADFSARDDPYQRAQIADDRQKSLAELDRVNKAIEEGNKAIATIEEEARKANVPPGWIR